MHDGSHLPRRPQPPAAVDPLTAQQIDLCRPGSDDSLLPELLDAHGRSLAARLQESAAARDRYQRVQELDCHICTALDDVPVPRDLPDRILDRLSQAAPLVPLAAPHMPSEAATQRAAAPGTVAMARVPRRRWWPAVALVAACVAVIVPLAIFLAGGPLQHSDAVVRRWQTTLANLAADPAFDATSSWRIDPPQPAWPIPPDILGQVAAWQPATVADTSGVAYRLVRSNRQAVLFVARRSVRGFAVSPEAARQPAPSAAGGTWVSVWQSPPGDYLYVLVVHGSEQDFLDFVRPKSVAQRSWPAPQAALLR
jgi:hypothetical protein